MTAIARPYAVAAFEYAQASKEISTWESMLDMAALIARDAKVSQLLTSPNLTKTELGELFCDVLAKTLNEERKNFIRLLAENNRLAVLPDIAFLFKTYRAAQEKTINVQVTSAVTLDEAYQAKLTLALTKRLDRQVKLECEINPDLIGGAIIRAGDTVIDGSIRGKLARLMDFI